MINIDFNKKEEFAQDYFSNFLQQEFHLTDEEVEAVELADPELNNELVSELMGPLNIAERSQALFNKISNDFLSDMNKTLLQYYMDIEDLVENYKDNQVSLQR